MGPGAIRYAEDCLSKRQRDAHNMPCIAGLNISDVFVLCKNLRGEIKLEAKTTVMHQVSPLAHAREGYSDLSACLSGLLHLHSRFKQKVVIIARYSLAMQFVDFAKMTPFKNQAITSRHLLAILQCSVSGHTPNAHIFHAFEPCW